MSKFLNVGIMQSTGSLDIEKSIERIESDVNALMSGVKKPELICGVELGIGMRWENQNNAFDTIPGQATKKLSEIARKHGVYFIPGSMTEEATRDGEKIYYNSIPVFDPDGDMIAVYRKICPYYPIEENITKGEDYVVFEIPEKNTRIGVINCHDWCFPEVSRAVTLLGAEVIIRPAVDPEGLYQTCKTIAPTRAFENQVYFISLNMVGEYMGANAYGHSLIASPDAATLYEAGQTEVNVTITLNLDAVRDARLFGTNYTEQLLRQYKYFDLKIPFYGKLADAPLYKDLPEPSLTVQDARNDHKNMI